MYKKLKVALVIPAHNEEELIKPTLENVPRTIDRIYVIDDGSTDRTVKIIKKIMKGDGRIRLIKHEKNMGVGQAIITGYKKVYKEGYDVVVVIGGDYQMDLKDLPNFLEPIHKGEADYVKGNRFLIDRRIKSKTPQGTAFKNMPNQRFWGNSILSFLVKFASGYWKIFDTQDGYTAIAKEALGMINWDEAWKGYGYVGDWLALFNVYNLRVKDVPRRAIYLKGRTQSQIKISRYIASVVPRMIYRFFWRLKRKYIFQNFHPLILFYGLSFILIPIGLLIGLYILWFKFTVGTITANTSILSALFLITGFQSLLFAILFDMQENEKLQP